jgi:hypothetical protein
MQAIDLQAALKTLTKLEISEHTPPPESSIVPSLDKSERIDVGIIQLSELTGLRLG